MKSLPALILFLLTLLSSAGFSQDSVFTIFRMDSLPPQGIELNKGWKFHEGDDTSWANASYDDSKWQSADLSHPQTYLPAFSKKGIGWFRLKLWMDSSLRSNPVALVISQLGAADFYVNNSLLIRFGKILSGGRVETNNPHEKPFIFQGSLSGDTISFAIRYASPPPYRPWMLTSNAALPLYVKISPWINALNDYKATLLGPRMRIGFSFMSIGLGLLFILLYTFFPKEKINILFGGFCFFLGIIPVLFSQLQEGNLNMNSYGWIVFVLEMLDRCCGALILSIIAIEVLKKISLFEILLISYVLIVDSLISIYFDAGPLKFILGIAARSLFSLAFLRLAVLAFSQRNFIIGIVASTSILLNLIFIIAELTTFNITRVFLFFNSFFCFIMVTIYVASKYAGKSRNLLLQLDQINKLSKENLSREKEKQQMLSAQNEMLEAQVLERTTALTHSLNELKETQSQLIQSEKMASLGELTAGIAHEIQNPLNFVNNFSEINAELIDEMNLALDQGKLGEVKSVSQDIRQNQEKISHHGKRADSIVKSMLLHSRANVGQKELTNINALADEYLRLSYHGLRAKDKSFNATLNTDFDETVGELQIVPQNLGRVLLNLFNNAFYAVSEKKQKLREGYSPTIWLSTRKLQDRIEIKVKDNGPGIPAKILDKIFQPFFTSKPVGQGTGLGLSLSYDIVTKEQRGQLKVQSEEGEYAEFVIQLPLES